MLFSFLYTVSSSIKLSTFLNCFLISIEDFQLLYFVLSDNETISLPAVIEFLCSYITLDNLPFNIFSMNFYLVCTIIILSYITLIINVILLPIIILRQVSIGYYENYMGLTYLMMFIGLIFLLSKLIINQPYYNNTINIIRSGIWSMIITISFIISLSKVYNLKDTLFIIFLVGIIGFIIGMLYYKYSSNKIINSIYIRYKKSMAFKNQSDHVSNLSISHNESLSQNSKTSEDDEYIEEDSIANESDNDFISSDNINNDNPDSFSNSSNNTLIPKNLDDKLNIFKRMDIILKNNIQKKLM
ncbi:hypothetical protein BCR36DRAFT_367498 [Piromyces finnis]|uniref:Uncharacterized protein n=1 Tax=Piromyces finnis TaxID=1754191 RepID=A0A1Y1VHL1_9FUNG|nr:hypothetical protein BCR36DRAFT_367498 [Piromyces finnis]|eukprot:ORX56532.1 hypothetical protein BCR36DRAFT_367498 [Piromyces finnis]